MYCTDVEKARAFATEIHADQKDKAGQPYIGHLARVADGVSRPEEKVVAWLHDSVEDHAEDGVTIARIAELFGAETAEAVEHLTHRSGEAYEDYVARAKDNPVSRAVKISDLIDNSNLSRLPRVTLKDIERQGKYNRALRYLFALPLFRTAARAEDARSPEELPRLDGMPPLMKLENGSPVETAEDWMSRRAELLALYSRWMYGKMPDPGSETVTWEVAPHETLPARKLTVHTTVGSATASFSVLVNLPEGPAPEGGWPCYLEYGFSWGGGVFISENCRYAASRGYAGITYFPTDVAADNERHSGAFYGLYPFDGDAGDFPGVLAAWAWGVSRVIDALENGAGAALGMDPENCIVAGVSRYGKSAAVAGAYDSRIRVTVPACSGSGGVAVYRTDNHGKEYDLSSLGGSDRWVNDSINEPLSNLQGGEGYWFCENFRKIADAESIPVEQYMLCALIAAPDRHLIVVTGITSEGWNNTEGQCLAWFGSQPAWDLLNSGDQNNMIIHLDGHAVLRSDMEMILDYCDVHLFGRDPAEVETDLSRMKGNLFLRDNRDRLDPAFDLLRRD